MGLHDDPIRGIPGFVQVAYEENDAVDDQDGGRLHPYLVFHVHSRRSIDAGQPSGPFRQKHGERHEGIYEEDRLPEAAVLSRDDAVGAEDHRGVEKSRDHHDACEVDEGVLEPLDSQESPQEEDEIQGQDSQEKGDHAYEEQDEATLPRVLPDDEGHGNAREARAVGSEV